MAGTAILLILLQEPSRLSAGGTDEARPAVARVVHTDDEIAWSSPVWVRKP